MSFTEKMNMKENPRFFDAITDFIFLEDKPAPVDIIFVPGGTYPESARNAARLYLEGYAPLVMPSGKYSILRQGFIPDPGQDLSIFKKAPETEWEYLYGILTACGVPESAILKEDQATFTWENAIYSKRVLGELGITVRTAILSCQAFHARRCLMYYQEQFPEVSFRVCPIVTQGIRAQDWFCSERSIDVVLGEVERCGSQFHEIMKDRLK